MKNQANVIATSSKGIGAKPGIPVTEITVETRMSMIIAIISGRLGFDFQK